MGALSIRAEAREERTLPPANVRFPPGLDMTADEQDRLTAHVPDALKCRFSQKVMNEPVVLNGRCYDRENITAYLRKHSCDPETRAPSTLADLRPSHNIRQMVEELLRELRSLRRQRHNELQEEDLQDPATAMVLLQQSDEQTNALVSPVDTEVDVEVPTLDMLGADYPWDEDSSQSRPLRGMHIQSIDGIIDAEDGPDHTHGGEDQGEGARPERRTSRRRRSPELIELDAMSMQPTAPPRPAEAALTGRRRGRSVQQDDETQAEAEADGEAETDADLGGPAAAPGAGRYGLRNRPKRQRRGS